MAFLHSISARPLTAVLAALCLIVVSACGTDQAGEASDSSPQMATPSDPIERGQESFMAYCASCHGEDGTGNGPVADVMSTQPADLTQLRAQYDGAFPTDSVYAYIDGRADVQAHGTREMPVWGNVWSDETGEEASREEIDLRIRELVEYIRSIQDEGADAS